MKNILFKLLLIDGNETSFIKDKDTLDLYRKLIIEVVKAEKNIRYCTNSKCPCHPEQEILRILEDKNLVEFLNNYAKGIVESLNEKCSDYVPVIADGIHED